MRTRNLVLGTLILVLAVALATPAAAADWTKFRFGPENRGYQDGNGPDNSTMLWEYSTGDDIGTAPAVVGGRVYFGNDEGYFYCLEADDGALVWRTLLGAKAKSSPAVADGKVFVGAGWNSSHVYCLDAANGGILWNHECFGGGSMVASPFVRNGRVYIGGDSGYFFCLDAANGNVVWYYDSDGQIWSSAALDADNGRLYFGNNNRYMTCLPLDDPDGSGVITSDEVVWSKRPVAGVSSTPLLVDGHLFFIDNEGRFYQFNPADGTEEWKSSSTYGSTYFASPAHYGGKFFFGTRSKIFYAMDQVTHEIKWQYQTNGYIDSSPACSNGRVYFDTGSNDWNMYCFKTVDGTLRWKDDTRAYQDASPALYNGVLYCGETMGDYNRMVAYAQSYATCSANAGARPNDGFPAAGALNPGDPGADDVRIDMASYDAVSGAGDLIEIEAGGISPGDLIVAGPYMHYVVRRNPVYDAYRGPTPQAGAFTAASLGDGRWAFDPPDADFLYPGDVMHYYFEATVDHGGAYYTVSDPPDLSGFGVFPGDTGYMPGLWPAGSTLRALPSVSDAVSGAHPPILVWLDSSGGADEEMLRLAMSWLGLVEGQDFDVYYTQDAWLNVGNGLGGRATSSLLAGYSTILYAGSDLTHHTLCSGGAGDPGNDLGLLTAWLGGGSRNLLLTGDDLTLDLANGGSAATGFLATVMGVTYLGNSVTPLVAGQRNVTVLPVPGSMVSFATPSWLALGTGTPLRYFDAIRPLGSALSVAAYAAPNGTPGGYTVSAGVLNAAGDDRVLTLPYDLGAVATAPGAAMPYPGLPAGPSVLADVLSYFGYPIATAPTSVPMRPPFAVRISPNPGNPRFAIDYQLPEAGRLRVAIYDLRGRLVHELLDETRPAGAGRVVWDGTDDHGRASATGVYVCRATCGDLRDVRKLTLAK